MRRSLNLCLLALSQVGELDGYVWAAYLAVHHLYPIGAPQVSYLFLFPTFQPFRYRYTNIYLYR